MDHADFYLFDRAFRRLSSVFRLRLKDEDLKELITSYFRLMEHARLDAVLAAAKVCATTCKTFPKPVEWLDALPKTPAAVTAVHELRRMGVEEADEWSRAEQLRYDDAPCDCGLCRLAGVTHRLIRFVPNIATDDHDECAIHPTRGRVVTGHWAHGEELARWYRAKEHFYATPIAPRVRTLLPQVLREREPGEEG